MEVSNVFTIVSLNGLMVEVIGYIIKGSNSAFSILPLCSQWGLTLKEKNLLL